MATIKENENFSLTCACKDLYDSIRGLGTNKPKLVQILTIHNNSQRQKIKEKYKFMYDADFKSDLMDERTVSGDFRDCLLVLLKTPASFDAISLHESLHMLTSHKTAIFECIKNRTNVKKYVIIEIMVSRNYDELKDIQEVYKKMYRKELDADFNKSFFLSNSLIKLLRTIAIQKRATDLKIDENQAIEDVKSLMDSEQIMFKYESELIRILTSRSVPQLNKLLEEYLKISHVDLTQKIKENTHFDDDFKECLLSIIQCATDMPGFFAIKINEYLNYKYGAKDHSVARVIMSRCEKDLELIKQRYFELFNQKLVDIVTNKTNGNFQKLLTTIIGQ